MNEWFSLRSPPSWGGRILIFLLLSWAFGAVWADAYAPAAEAYAPVELLLEATESIVGEPLVFPSQGQARVSAWIVTIAPGTATGWHRHGAPMFAYLLSGSLEVEYEGGATTTLHAGDALLEAMQVAHIGRNHGTEPARVLAVFMEDESTTRTLPVPAPVQQTSVQPET